MKRLDHIFPRGDMFRLIPAYFKTVFPGERTQVSMRGHLESDVIAALRCPAVFSSYAFYVPFRLVWAGFEQFIADADSVAQIPTVSYVASPFAELGETGANTYTTLHRRALKLIYNEFFGDDAYGAHAFYTDFTNDAAQNSCLPLKTVNQFLSNIALDVDEPADNYAVAASTIELTEFRRRLKQNARGNNQRIGGEKYVDALRRFGVDMREALAARPEMIGRESEVVYPQEVFNTSETNTGARVGRYRIAVNFKTKRKFHMEHGVVMVFHSLRPFLARTIPPMDRWPSGRRYFQEEMEKQYIEIPSTVLGTATDVEPDPLMPMAQWHNLGDMLVLNGGTGTLSYASNAALANLVYPSVAGSPKVDLALSVDTETVRNGK